MLTVLTLVPSILICMTPFARLLIVFHFLRQALGLQTTPSNQTLIGLSVILTFFLMQPVASQIYQEAAVPMQAGEITPIEALERAEIPMHKFMGHYVREKDVALFVGLAKEPRPASVDDISMRVLLPAYILSELKAGFRDWDGSLSSVPDRGHGGGFDHDLGRHVAVAAGGDLDAAKAVALSDGGWMALVDRFADEELWLTLWTLIRLCCSDE